MEICKAPTLWLKALNKHSITHIMYIKMENVDVHVRGKNHTKTCECVSERNTVTMDECFLKKRPTMMCLAKKKKEKILKVGNW